jgi:hypothetical protein
LLLALILALSRRERELFTDTLSNRVYQITGHSDKKNIVVLLVAAGSPPRLGGMLWKCWGSPSTATDVMVESEAAGICIASLGA